ncbi:MAG TPA: DnaB-like helicase N-terminal domain-containing protein, partial [Ktedonobacteraceae bacterium]
MAYPQNGKVQKVQADKWFAAEEAEECLLGSVMFNPQSIERVIDTLKPGHFSRDIHSKIYEAIIYLYQMDRKCTPSNVKDELKRRGDWDDVVRFEGEGYLKLLSIDIATLDTVEDYQYKILRTARSR